MTQRPIDAGRFSARYYEPEPRMCAGRMQWVRHRFPINGGITIRDVMARDLARPSMLMRFIGRWE